MVERTGPIYGFSLRSTWLKDHGGRAFIEALAGMGFGSLEVMPDSAQDAGFSLDQITDAIQEQGLMACYHAPYVAGVRLAEAEDSRIREVQGIYLGVLDEAARAARVQGHATTVNLHGASGPRDPSRARELHHRTLQLLRWSTRVAQMSGQGVLIAIELLPSAPERIRIGEDYDELVRLVEATHSSYLGITWDMGHGWATQRRRPEPQLPDEAFLTRVVHTHIHDLDPEARDHSPLVYGNAPLAETRGQFVGPGGLVGHEGQGHQVGLFPEGDFLQQVVLDLHLDIPGRERSQIGQGHAQEPAALAAVQAAIAITGGLDQ